MMTVVVVASSLCRGRKAGVAAIPLPLLLPPPLLLVTADTVQGCSCLPLLWGGVLWAHSTGAMSTFLGLGEGLSWLLVPDNTSLLRFVITRSFPSRSFFLSFTLVSFSNFLSLCSRSTFYFSSLICTFCYLAIVAGLQLFVLKHDIILLIQFSCV